MVRAATESSHNDTPYVVGWDVCVPAAKATGKPRAISGRFTVKAAAEQFCEMSKRVGTPDCYVREVIGLEGKK